MKSFTQQEVVDALPRVSPQAQLEIQNAMLAARVERYEELAGQQELEIEDGI